MDQSVDPVMAAAISDDDALVGGKA